MDKNLFVSTINSIREQMEYDLAYSAVVAEAFKAENASVYDNSLLIKSIIRLLQIHFPPKNNHCEISFYCFECNFGKFGDTDYLSPEQLYDQLTNSN